MKTRKEQKPSEPCPVCHGRGWLLMFNTDRRVSEIQRCDACDRYASDEEAGDAASPVIEAALALADAAISSLVGRARQGKKP